jgi:hypothetical protein
MEAIQRVEGKALPVQQVLCDGCEISGELSFSDDEVVLNTGLNQTKVSKSLHKYADARTGRTYHCRQLFVRNPKLDAYTLGIFLSKLPPELQ